MPRKVVPSQPRPVKEGVRFYDDDPKTVSNESAMEFIEDVQELLTNGFGIIPLVGAGFSAPAGIPLISEMCAYLNRCIRDALVSPIHSATRSGRRWNPRVDRWPPLVDHLRPEPFDWLGDVYAEFIRRRSVDPYDPELSVLQEAFGAMAEWRSSLLFLSRIALRNTPELGRSSRAIYLDAPSQDVIDACFREVMRNKNPALNHRMLATLAGLLRLDLILSTNFDDLLERAFTNLRSPLEVFDVQLDTRLPHWSAVSRVKALVKLHGSQHSLRADFSLDAFPPAEELHTFLEYLAGRTIEAHGAQSEIVECRNHLLVLGVSAAERRTCARIEHAWRFSRNLRVYWVCFSPEDVARVQEFTRSFVRRHSDCERLKGGKACPPLCCVIRHTDIGLLLMQLYQVIRRNIPPTGALFPSAALLPVPPYPTRASELPRPAVGPRHADSSALETEAASSPRTDLAHEVESRLKEFKGSHGQKFEGYKLVVATSEPTQHGVTSACSRVFWKLNGGSVCLWLDMNDISCADSLFEVLLEACHRSLGLENWTPVYLEHDARHRAAEIRRLVDRSTKPWVIFINARETPGANTDEEVAPKRANKEMNGWLDQLLPGANARNELGIFIELLAELCGRRSPRISVVLQCYGKESVLVKALAVNGLIDKPLSLGRAETTQFDVDDRAKKVIEWANNPKNPDRDERRSFLQCIVLLQRSRFLSTIWQIDTLAPGGPGTQAFRESREMKWIKDLERMHVVRWKPGGFIWLHSPIRYQLRCILLSRGQVSQGWYPSRNTESVHLKLSRWYLKVLDATRSPAAIFEGAYHCCKAALAASSTSAVDHIVSATSLLKANSFLIQTHGYSRGSCRRLEHIRTLSQKLFDKRGVSDAVKEKVIHLQLICGEIMRAIAREVGEDSKTYLRQREIMRAMAGECFTAEGRAWNARSRQAYQDAEPVGWLRCRRWLGMLAIASRSFAVAERQLILGITEAIPAITGSAPHAAKGNFNIQKSRVRKDTKGVITPVLTTDASMNPARIEILRAIEELMNLILLRDGVKRRLAAMSLAPRPEKDTDDDLKFARDCGLAAIEVVHYIQSTDCTADSQATIQANWCKSRVLIHMSHVELRYQEVEAIKARSLGNAPLRYQPAMSFLGDAEACLRVSMPHRYKADLAVVDLNRAEVRIREALLISLPTIANIDIGGDVVKHNGLTKFGHICSSFLYITLSSPHSWNEICEKNELASNRRTLVNELFADPNDVALLSRFRQIRSLAVDAIRFLNRAEAVLKERRRNVWWTTWYCERRLRAISLVMWAHILENDGTIPYLGLEVAVDGIETEPDQLLEEAVRTIRTDCYRLATIVEAYAVCAKALEVRMHWDSNAFGFEARLLRMRQRLQWALGELRSVWMRRQHDESNAKRREDKDQLDGDVDKFVSSTVALVEKVTQGLGVLHSDRRTEIRPR